MDNARLREILSSLFDKKLSQSEYVELTAWLREVIKRCGRELEARLGKKYGSEARPKDILEKIERHIGMGVEDLALEFLKHLLSKRDRLRELLDTSDRLKSYLYAMGKNFLVDVVRKAGGSENPPVLFSEIKADNDDSDRTPSYEGRDESHVRRLELWELREFCVRSMSPEELKVMCYLLDKKRFACFWADKSKDAMYKFVSRNRKAVEEKVILMAKEFGVSEELMKDLFFIMKSEVCEKMRLELCKEE